MAYTPGTYTGNGSNRDFSVPFSYIAKADVIVTVSGTEVSFTWNNDAQIKTATAPANGAPVVVYRSTPIDSPVVTFQPGPLNSSKLNSQNAQLLYRLQEELEADNLASEFVDAVAAQVALAADQVTLATAQKTLAATSATAAAASATAASGSASAAATSATAAASSATTATTQATAAAASATASAGSATTATTQATNAASSATTAGTQATNAATSATAAAGSATTAGTQATNAATSATAAATSATNAALYGQQAATDAEARTGTATNRSLTPANLSGRAKFKAHKNGTNQTAIADSTNTKLTWGTEAYDIGSCFASDGWTPPAGKVRLSLTAVGSGTITYGASCYAMIYKNGSVFVYSPIQYCLVNNTFGFNVDTTDDANGSDVYTAYINIDTASGTATVTGSASQTFFSGEQI